MPGSLRVWANADGTAHRLRTAASRDLVMAGVSFRLFLSVQRLLELGEQGQQLVEAVAAEAVRYLVVHAVEARGGARHHGGGLRRERQQALARIGFAGAALHVALGLEVLEDAREAGRQQVAALGELARIHLAVEMQYADHAPLLLSGLAAPVQRAEILHHRLARAQQGDRQRPAVVPDASLRPGAFALSHRPRSSRLRTRSAARRHR